MEIDNLLKDHCLVKKPIVKNKLSLFLALSEALYFTSVYKHHIQDILKEELKNR